MIIIIPTIQYGSTYYNTFTKVCSNYHGYFFQCNVSNESNGGEVNLEKNAN